MDKKLMVTITDYVPKYLSVRGTGPREVTREGFGNYYGAGYEKVFLYTRSYHGAGQNGTQIMTSANFTALFSVTQKLLKMS